MKLFCKKRLIIATLFLGIVSAFASSLVYAAPMPNYYKDHAPKTKVIKKIKQECKAKKCINKKTMPIHKPKLKKA